MALLQAHGWFLWRAEPDSSGSRDLSDASDVHAERGGHYDISIVHATCIEGHPYLLVKE
jgi:hypothetical protein